MPGRNYSIQPATLDDRPTLANLLYTSKLPLTINRLLWDDWPDEEAQRAQYRRAVEGGLSDPATEAFKVSDGDLGEVIGHLYLTHKTPSRDECEPTEVKEGDDVDVQDGDKTEARKGLGGGINAAVAAAVGSAVAEADTETGTEHLHITHIFVASAHRRRGVGSRLVQLGIDRAEAAGLSLVVLAEPAAHEFFLRLGFKDTKHAVIDLTKWAPEYTGFGEFRLFGMVRSTSREVPL